MALTKIADGGMPAGAVLQVVQGSTSTTATATSSFIDTGLTASITPSFTSSKILVTVQQQGCTAVATNTGSINMKLQRGSSDIHNVWSCLLVFGWSLRV